jgi:hypothetical protein
MSEAATAAGKSAGGRVVEEGGAPAAAAAAARAAALKHGLSLAAAGAVAGEVAKAAVLHPFQAKKGQQARGGAGIQDRQDPVGSPAPNPGPGYLPAVPQRVHRRPSLGGLTYSDLDAAKEHIRLAIQNGRGVTEPLCDRGLYNEARALKEMLDSLEGRLALVNEANLPQVVDDIEVMFAACIKLNFHLDHAGKIRGFIKAHMRPHDKVGQPWYGNIGIVDFKGRS